MIQRVRLTSTPVAFADFDNGQVLNCQFVYPRQIDVKNITVNGTFKNQGTVSGVLSDVQIEDYQYEYQNFGSGVVVSDPNLKPVLNVSGGPVVSTVYTDVVNLFERKPNPIDIETTNFNLYFNASYMNLIDTPVVVGDMVFIELMVCIDFDLK